MNAAALLAGRIWLIHAPALAALRLRLDALDGFRLGPEPGPRPEPRSVLTGRPWPGYRIEDGIGYVSIRGPIVNQATPIDELLAEVFGGTVLANVRSALEDARTDRNVKGILMEVDSPGGEAAGVAETARLIRALDARKPVVAHVEGYGASAAYWLAAAAGSIVGDPSSFTGSIGVLGEYLDDAGMLEKMGLKRHRFVSIQSPRKIPDPESPEGADQIREQIDSLADVMIADIGNYRGVTPLYVAENMGQGDIKIAAEAVRSDVGLIDYVGSRNDALKVLGKRIRGAGKPRARLSTPAARTGSVSARLAGASSGRPVARLGAPQTCRVSSS